MEPQPTRQLPPICPSTSAADFENERDPKEQRMPEHQKEKEGGDDEASPYEESFEEASDPETENDMDTAAPPPGFSPSDDEREKTKAEMRVRKLLPILRAEKSEKEKIEELEEVIERQVKRRAEEELKKTEKKLKSLETFRAEAQRKFETRVDMCIGPDRPMNVRVNWVPPPVGIVNEVSEGEWVTDSRSLGIQCEMTTVATLRLAEKVRHDPFPSGRGAGSGGKVKIVHWDTMGKDAQRTWRKRRSKVGKEIEAYYGLQSLRQERREEAAREESRTEEAAGRKGRVNSTDSGYISTPPTRPTREEREELKRRAREAPPTTRRNDGRKTTDAPTTSTPKPLPSSTIQPVQDIEMTDAADPTPSTAQQQQQQQQQQQPQTQPQMPEEPVLDIRPSIADLVTIDKWGTTKSNRNDKEARGKGKEEGRKDDKKNREDHEKEERKREREWKMKQDEEVRRKERRRREDYKDAQRRHYRGYHDDRKFSWDTSRGDESYRNNVPPVESHFGRYRLTRDNRPATFERPNYDDRSYARSFKKTWSRQEPEQIVSINRHNADDSNQGRRRRNETGNSYSTLDEEDRDPRRKRKN